MPENLREYFNSQVQLMSGKTPPRHVGCNDCPMGNLEGDSRKNCFSKPEIIIGPNNLAQFCLGGYLFKADLTEHEWIGPFNTSEKPNVGGTHASDFNRQDDSHVG